jgi:hypothetical protein
VSDAWVSIIVAAATLVAINSTGCASKRQRVDKPPQPAPPSSTVSVAAMPPADGGFAPSRAPTPLPLNILSRTCLLSPIGNGIGPIATAYDGATHVLYILNEKSSNLLVVNARSGTVLKSGAIRVPHSSKATMIFEPDRHLLWIVMSYQASEGATDEACRVVAVSTDTLRVLKDRQLETSREPVHAALNARRHELYIGSEGLSVLDTRTLRVKRRSEPRRTIGPIVIDDSSDLVYFAEEPPGDLSSDDYRIVAWSPRSGAVLSRSRESYSRNTGFGLFINDQGHGPVVVHASDDGAPKVDQLSSTLRRRSTTDIAELSFPVWDSRRMRVVGEGEHSDLIVESLGGRPGITRHAFPQYRNDEESRLESIDPSTGDLFLTSANALYRIDVLTGKSRWRLSLGASINAIFVDHRSHRLVVSYETDTNCLAWVDRGTVRPFFKKIDAGDIFPYGSYLMDVDFDHEWLYQEDGPGRSKYIYRISFDGRQKTDWPGISEPVHNITIGKRPEQTYRLIFPIDTDVEAPEAYVGVYDGPREVRRIPIGKMPQVMLYSPSADRLYFADQGWLQPLGSKRVPLPDRAVTWWDAVTSHYYNQAICIDEAGLNVYYFSPSQMRLYKLRLADGKIVGVRQMPFAPSHIAIDNGRGTIYLVDWPHGQIVSARLF